MTAPSEESSLENLNYPKSGGAALSQEQVWSSLGGSVMTSMVFMLDYIGILSNIIHAQFNSWSLSDLESLLKCLEASYHHARCFNANSDLRLSLWKKGFMRYADNSQRLPHLVEQETSSMAQLLILSFKMYTQEEESHEDAAARSNMAESIVLRYCITFITTLSFF